MAKSLDIPFPLPQVSATQRARAARLAQALAKHYPDAHCELDYRSPHELLIATILSAQSTDAGVNKATPALFARFPTPSDFATSTPAEIETLIKTIGLYRNKARAVHESMKEVTGRFNGHVPRTMDELLTLRGVARKTANVVLGNAYGINVGFVVDTHIDRLSKRFGLVPQDANVQQIERLLMALFPRDQWCTLSHQLIWHGRRACKARGCDCSAHAICAQFGPCGPDGVKSARCEGCPKSISSTSVSKPVHKPASTKPGNLPSTKKVASATASSSLKKGPRGGARGTARSVRKRG